MKKLFTLCLLAVTMCAVAQNKKIALLEPRAGEGSDSIAPMEKAMIRGEMRKAIALQDGWEAFSRSDIDQMMREQDFQHSGMVSENSIHKLGEMTGADYICVANITKSSTEFYIEAYLINIETGRISSPASQYGELVNGKFSNLLPVCQWLAQELVGKTPQKNVIQPSQNNYNQNSYQDYPQSSNNSQYIQPAAQDASVKTPIYWSIDSRPSGADLSWRVISSNASVKSQNSKYLATTPYETTEALNIPGLNSSNASEVQIEIKCEREGYYTQSKRFNVASILDEKELNIFFKLVKEE